MSDGWFVKATGINLDADLLHDVTMGNANAVAVADADTVIDTVNEQQNQIVKETKIESVTYENISDPYYEIPIFDFDDIDIDVDSQESDDNYNADSANNNDNDNNCNRNVSNNNINNKNNNNIFNNNDTYYNLNNNGVDKKIKSKQYFINSESRQNTVINSSINKSDNCKKNQFTIKNDSSSEQQVDNDKNKNQSQNRQSTPAIYLISQSAGFSVKNKFVTQGKLDDLLLSYRTNNE